MYVAFYFFIDVIKTLRTSEGLWVFKHLLHCFTRSFLILVFQSGIRNLALSACDDKGGADNSTHTGGALVTYLITLF